MKILKYVLIAMAVLGIAASIYNMIYENSLNDIEGLLLGVVVIIIAFNLEKIIHLIKKK